MTNFWKEMANLISEFYGDNKVHVIIVFAEESSSLNVGIVFP